MRNTKSILALLLALLLCLSIVNSAWASEEPFVETTRAAESNTDLEAEEPTPALDGAEIASGTCGAEGDNLTWSLTEDGVLTISGTGRMEDYYVDTLPWYEYLSAIRSVWMEDGITSLGMHAFSNCVNLESIRISNDLEAIGDYAFSDCKSLIEISLPASFNSLHTQPFVGCISLKRITVADNEIVRPYYFYSNDGVLFDHYGADRNELVCCPGGREGAYLVPDDVVKIGYRAFDNCVGLTSVTIPDSVTTIENSAFERCRILHSVVIGAGVEKIGKQVFDGCDTLTSISVDENNPVFSSVDGVLFIKDMSKLIRFPMGLRGEYMIPDGTYEISEKAFLGCSELTKVTIPNSVAVIGDWAFNDFDSRTAVYYNGTRAAWEQVTLGESAIPEYVSVRCLDDAPVIPGDANGDGELTMEDALQLITGKEPDIPAAALVLRSLVGF